MYYLLIILMGGIYLINRYLGPFYLALYYYFLPGIRVIKDISYGKLERLKLDIYQPSGAVNEKSPVIFYGHGGGWRSNSKGKFKFIGKYLARQGYVVVIPNYRLLPENRYPVQVDDIAKALAWTEGNIGQYGGDEERIILSGHSAGAHLVSLVGFSNRWQEKYQINPEGIIGFILFAGVYIFSDKYEKGHPLIKQLVSKDDWKEAQPINHLTADAAPSLILHGSQDQTVDPQQSIILEREMVNRGITHKSIFPQNLNHRSMIMNLLSKQSNVWQEVKNFINEITEKQEKQEGN